LGWFGEGTGKVSLQVFIVLVILVIITVIIVITQGKE
jgi:hypothetical protein